MTAMEQAPSRACLLPVFSFRFPEFSDASWAFQGEAVPGLPFMRFY